MHSQNCWQGQKCTVLVTIKFLLLCLIIKIKVLDSYPENLRLETCIFVVSMRLSQCFRRLSDRLTNPGKIGFGLVNFRIASDRMSCKSFIKNFYLQLENNILFGNLSVGLVKIIAYQTKCLVKIWTPSRTLLSNFVIRTFVHPLVRSSVCQHVTLCLWWHHAYSMNTSSLIIIIMYCVAFIYKFVR